MPQEYDLIELDRQLRTILDNQEKIIVRLESIEDTQEEINEHITDIQKTEQELIVNG